MPRLNERGELYKAFLNYDAKHMWGFMAWVRKYWMSCSTAVHTKTGADVFFALQSRQTRFFYLQCQALRFVWDMQSILARRGAITEAWL